MEFVEGSDSVVVGELYVHGLSQGFIGLLCGLSAQEGLPIGPLLVVDLFAHFSFP